MRDAAAAASPPPLSSPASAPSIAAISASAPSRSMLPCADETRRGGGAGAAGRDDWRDGGANETGGVRRRATSRAIALGSVVRALSLALPSSHDDDDDDDDGGGAGAPLGGLAGAPLARRVATDNGRFTTNARWERFRGGRRTVYDECSSGAIPQREDG